LDEDELEELAEEASLDLDEFLHFCADELDAAEDDDEDEDEDDERDEAEDEDEADERPPFLGGGVVGAFPQAAEAARANRARAAAAAAAAVAATPSPAAAIRPPSTGDAGLAP
jgi:hypothetical protein